MPVLSAIPSPLLGSGEATTDRSLLDFDQVILLHHLSFPSAQAQETSRNAEVAQLVEHSPEKAGVDSSILSLGTISSLFSTIPHSYEAQNR